MLKTFTLNLASGAPNPNLNNVKDIHIPGDPEDHLQQKGISMTTATHVSPLPSQPGWFTRAENWLDSKGKGAWIAAMVLGFVFFWPVGLALLFYMIWSKRMFTSCSRKSTSMRNGMRAMRPSGNSAFDAYKTDTLRRLEEEQEQFEAFLERLRDAKDKAEFDQFMEDRSRKGADPAPEA